MATYSRLPRGRNKKPDQFISFFDRLYHKAYGNGFKILIVLSIGVLVGFGVLFWRGLHKQQALKIANILFEMNQKSEKEQEEILKNIQKKNLFQPIGIWASLELSNRAEKNGNCDQVVEELHPYIGYGENKVLRSLVYLKVGECLQMKGDLAKAEEVYQKGAFDSKNLTQDWCQLRLAVVLKLMNKNEEAKKILREIIQIGSKASEPVKDQARSTLYLSFS